jgi:hypothetical protein
MEKFVEGVIKGVEATGAEVQPCVLFVPVLLLDIYPPDV